MKIPLPLLLISISVMMLVSCSEDVEAPRYRPSHDITSLLIEDLEAGNDITLDSGIYYLSESIMVEGYCGTISGAGKGKTIIQPLEEFKVTDWPDDANLPNLEVAVMFSIYYPNCDVTFQDITFKINGHSPAETHDSQWGLNRRVMDYVLLVGGVKEVPINVIIRNIEVIAEHSGIPHTSGKNLCSAIMVGCMEKIDDKQPINLLVENSNFSDVGIGDIVYFNSHGGHATIFNNQFANSHDPVSLIPDMKDMYAHIEGNNFYDISGDIVYNEYDVRCCFRDNLLDGQALPDDCQ